MRPSACSNASCSRSSRTSRRSTTISDESRPASHRFPTSSTRSCRRSTTWREALDGMRGELAGELDGTAHRPHRAPVRLKDLGRPRSRSTGAAPTSGYQIGVVSLARRMPCVIMGRLTPTPRAVALVAALVVAILAAAGGGSAQARGPGGACAVGRGPVSPTPSTAAPPADVLGRFGVLARPATIADQVPVLNTLGLDLAGAISLGSYDSGYIRFLATLPANRQLFLIPGSPAKLALPPPSCLPAKARGPLEQIMDDQAKLARGPVFCLAVIGSRSASVGAPSACFPFALEPNGYAIASVGQNTIGNPSRTLAGLVPDGVSSVALSFSRAPRLTAATRQQHVRRARGLPLPRRARATPGGGRAAQLHTDTPACCEPACKTLPSPPATNHCGGRSDARALART